MDSLRSPEETKPKATPERLLPIKRIPVSTYRLQFNPSFTFKDARKLVRYLHELGITDCYCSPYFKSRPGSVHGYDVCDHQALNPELGGEREYEAFVAELKRHGMGQILDVVPNHMSIWETSNAKWMDVLENGPASPYAAFFDIDWHPIRGDTDLENRVLLPILGASYGEVLENQELALRYDRGAFLIDYCDHRLPVDPWTCTDILRPAVKETAARLGSSHSYTRKLERILTAIGRIPPRLMTEPDRVLERQRTKEANRVRLERLCGRCNVVRDAIQAAVRSFNGIRGDPASFDRLDALLDQQSYRLADWRVAAEEINYRRFFDINDLAALRTEDPRVFDHIHQLVFRLLAEGKVTGLRIDHIDGLWDPGRYLEKLQDSYLQALGRGQQPGGARADNQTHVYVVVEKILSKGESLPRGWAADGTTGYDFANATNGIFVDAAARKAFDAIYESFTGRSVRFQELVMASKKMVMSTSLASEMNMLSHQLKRIAARHRRYRDFTLSGITLTLREVIASLPIYRTYIGERPVDERDRRYIEDAVEDAKRRCPRDHPIFDFLRDILLLQWPEHSDEANRAEMMRFVYGFQQVTGPVMAKALEDTALYIYNRLISLNEVGGHPGQFGISVSSFHEENADRLKRWPHSLLCTSTHDTKRSEDVRARIDVLSEMPQEWKAALTRWNRLNRRHKTLLNGEPVPNRNEEYYLYQTLLGAWPIMAGDGDYGIFVERMQAHMIKALREAKLNSNWINPNGDYEDRVQKFVGAILDRTKENPFLDDFRVFQKGVAHYGIWNSLSQTLLKITSPGVPDFYQGTEVWDFSLVDPDNRRPVDYTLRIRMLRALRRRMANTRHPLARLARELVDTREDGRIKMYLIHVALTYRLAHTDLFQAGSYIPLEGRGRQKEHICAFARKKEGQTATVVVPRLVLTLTRGDRVPPLGSEIWGTCFVTLPPGEAAGLYRNVFTNEMVQAIPLEDDAIGLPLASVLASFPVALLERAS